MALLPRRSCPLLHNFCSLQPNKQEIPACRRTCKPTTSAKIVPAPICETTSTKMLLRWLISCVVQLLMRYLCVCSALETTILFADIVGFTAWSSVREPSQVFLLLESLFRAFDDCASRRRVFKVETVGDCYVAVTGLPDPRKDHALAMVRFARDCLNALSMVLKELEGLFAN